VASASWKERVIYSFQGGNDGAIPAGGVVPDKAGNLYGATSQGGGSNCPPISNCGTVFQLSPPVKKGDRWTETILHVFLGVPGNDGATPAGSVVIDANGNLYGTTGYGGSGGCVLVGIKGGCGTVYELSPPQTKGGAWTYTILYSFQGGNDGYFPWGDLTLDNKGNLYGATQFGGGKGTSCNPFYQYCGTVFELSPPRQKGGKWTEKVLHSFAGGIDGASPNGGLQVRDKGEIYGTTEMGGNHLCDFGMGQVGCGIIFELMPRYNKKSSAMTEKVLHRFAKKDGASPASGLTPDVNGAFYGTGASGGPENGIGVVFHLGRTKKGGWKETVLYSFQGRNDGRNPLGPLTLDSTGVLFGTASVGQDYGLFFRFKPNGKVYKVLYNFRGSPDGDYPASRLTQNKVGGFYGTTLSGGTGQTCHGGCGSVWEISH
jgi:hypothetical protein